MKIEPAERPAVAPLAPALAHPLPGLPVALGRRVANIALTAQVQFAYACAQDAQSRARRAATTIERNWPDTPLRTLVLDAYRAQASTAAGMARKVLENARRRCGLAYARF